MDLLTFTSNKKLLSGFFFTIIFIKSHKKLNICEFTKIILNHLDFLNPLYIRINICNNYSL